MIDSFLFSTILSNNICIISVHLPHPLTKSNVCSFYAWKMLDINLWLSGWSQSVSRPGRPPGPSPEPHLTPHRDSCLRLRPAPPSLWADSPRWWCWGISNTHSNSLITPWAPDVLNQDTLQDILMAILRIQDRLAHIILHAEDNRERGKCLPHLTWLMKYLLWWSCVVVFSNVTYSIYNKRNKKSLKTYSRD